MDSQGFPAAQPAWCRCGTALQHRSRGTGGLEKMSEWEDVVTTGLIGTDRRPVPDALPASWGLGLDHASDPAHAVLSIAARHRAASRAGDLLLSCPPGPSGPPNRAPLASRAAHEILARLLSPPQVELLNLWLVAAVQSGQQASAAYWT